MTNWKTALASCVLFTVLMPTGRAETLIDVDRDGKPFCIFQGAITKAEVRPFVQALARGCKTVYLNSRGGDVDAAIQMGRAVRKALATTVVLQQTECSSACVFMYAGGIYRANWGPIKIHRPYVNSSFGSFDASQQAHRQLEERVRRYLRDVNVQESLFDRMLRTPPERAEALSLEYMDSVGLGSQDPTYANHIDAQAAARAGVTIETWLRAKRRAAETCGEIAGPIDAQLAAARVACWNSILPEAR